MRGANRCTRVVGVFVPARDVRRPIRRRAHHRARVVTVIADVAVLAVLRGARALGRDAASSFDNRKAKNIAGVESARGDLEDVTGAAHRRHLEAFPETPVFAPSAAARAPDELHAADRPRNERVIHIVRNAANVYAELDLTTARAEERVRPGDDADARASRIKHRHRPDERRHADGQRTDHNHHNRARTARATAIAFASRQQRRLRGRIRRSAARHDGATTAPRRAHARTCSRGRRARRVVPRGRVASHRARSRSVGRRARCRAMPPRWLVSRTFGVAPWFTSVQNGPWASVRTFGVSGVRGDFLAWSQKTFSNKKKGRLDARVPRVKL